VSVNGNNLSSSCTINVVPAIPVPVIVATASSYLLHGDTETKISIKVTAIDGADLRHLNIPVCAGLTFDSS
jgi:hypothetical protein